MFSAHPPGRAPPTAQQGPPFLPHNLGPPTSTRVTLETPEGKPLELPPAPSRGKGAAPAPASQPAKIQLSTPDGKPLELPPAPARKHYSDNNAHARQSGYACGCGGGMSSVASLPSDSADSMPTWGAGTVNDAWSEPAASPSGIGTSGGWGMGGMP